MLNDPAEVNDADENNGIEHYPNQQQQGTFYRRSVDENQSDVYNSMNLVKSHRASNIEKQRSIINLANSGRLYNRKSTVDLKRQSDVDAVTYRMSVEQYEEIFLFVDERRTTLLLCLKFLHFNLEKNATEDEKLPLILENIKNFSRDIENCYEDILQFKVEGDSEYIDDRFGEALDA